MPEAVSYYEDSKEIEKKIWELLWTAVKDRSSEFRTPVFICGNDKDLDGRVVVLRKADQKNSFVQYHSDIRSSKIEKIQKGKFKKQNLVTFCKSEKYKHLKPKYSLLRIDGKVVPLENKPTQETGLILSHAMGY